MGGKQRNAYQLTINNPLDYGYEHSKIRHILTTQFSTIRYFCMADEIGESGTHHTHIYVYFTSRVRFDTIKKHFNEAHIEVAMGTVQSNIEYVKKTGRWLESHKAETKIEGSFEEWGAVPIQKGKKADMEDLYQMIKAGYSNAQILEMNNDYILNIDKLDKVRTTILQEKYKNTRRLDIKVVYIYGATGTSKTRGILDQYGDANVYRVTDYKHPFDSYNCQETIVFEEFRSGISCGNMLNYLDVYAIELESRYVNKFACYSRVFFTSNWKLEEQYKDIQKNSPETWKAFLRRIHEVRVHHKNGKIDVYNSVEEYMNRESKFESVEEEDIPFE